MKSNTEAPPSDSDESEVTSGDVEFDAFLKSFVELLEHPQAGWREEVANDDMAN